jgi:acyl-coenzyme A synthetase/AMP-(fatty) acid ligase
VPAAGHDATASALRKSLSALVPGYMLPARWMRLELLPKNENGKIDRPRLRNAFAQVESRQPQLEAH